MFTVGTPKILWIVIFLWFIHSHMAFYKKLNSHCCSYCHHIVYIYIIRSTSYWHDKTRLSFGLPQAMYKSRILNPINVITVCCISGVTYFLHSWTLECVIMPLLTKITYTCVVPLFEIQYKLVLVDAFFSVECSLF